ncbi:MAG: class I SAM-dependent methyltransferase [Phycisphaerales bacterium]|nr:class I SAM-dependent methyltransferase [Phycisphaerales bacterium]
MKSLHRPVYERRLRVLVDLVLPHIREDDRVLDVGCGNGTLGRAIMDDPRCPKGVVVEGLERVPRGGEPITVHAYPEGEAGKRLPFSDDSYDVVIVADVLHHEPEEDRLIAECARVARRFVVIKDHQVKGVLAQRRIALMDWAANAPYGVPCLYRYNSPRQWREKLGRLGLEPVAHHDGINLYPVGWNLVFGRGLQYMSVLRVPDAGVGAALDAPSDSLSAEARAPRDGRGNDRA